jgi:hypothetical protein
LIKNTVIYYNSFSEDLQVIYEFFYAVLSEICQRDKARGQASRQQACGEHEGQSLSVKAQKRREHNKKIADKLSIPKMRG